MEVLGIDIGGSGIKGAPVDLVSGELLAERIRISTPQPATPEAVAQVVAEITQRFVWEGPVGCAFPAVVKRGIVHTAANVDRSWIGRDGQRLFEEATDCPVVLVNDADAAGVAEMHFGAGRGETGVVIVLTLGTGIGSAIIVDGQLVPNTELGHLVVRGKDAEKRASDRARQEKKLSWKQWAGRLNEYLTYLERLFSPDLFVIGGGVSKDQAQFFRYLKTEARLRPAGLRNEAGIVGAALVAAPLRPGVARDESVETLLSTVSRDGAAAPGTAGAPESHPPASSPSETTS